jgi:hypothetical protein
MRIAAIILSASTDHDKIAMTQSAINSVQSEVHQVDVYVVDSHRLIKYKNAKTILVDREFNYNYNLKEGYFQAIHNRPFGYYSRFIVLNNDVILSPDCIDKLVQTGIDSCSPKDPTLNLHDSYKGIVFGYRTSYQVCGWALMFSLDLVRKCTIGALFPNELPFWYQDNFYAHVIKKHGYNHGLVCDAHCVHLESKSHNLITDLPALTDKLKPVYDGLVRQFDLQFSQNR